MKGIPFTLHLTIHNISFHLKFPATLSLELQIDKTSRDIISDVPLGADTITLNKDISTDLELVYDEFNKTYEMKKISIVIYIKTKTSQNRLIAGIVPVQINRPTQQLNRILGRPLRCNDLKAYIEYSIRIEVKPRNSTLSTNSKQDDKGQLRLSQKKDSANVFKSAVNYINNELKSDGQPQKSYNELQAYLDASFGKSKNQQRKTYKSTGKYRDKMRESWEQEESKTEKLSYRKDMREDSIVCKQDNFIQNRYKQLSRKSQHLSKDLTETRKQNELLVGQNKQLKSKIKIYEQQLQEQTSLIQSLQKRWQAKQNCSNDQLTTLKRKLQQVENQLHQLMYEKNTLLSDRQIKQKQLLTSYRQKEKIYNEERKKFIVQLQVNENKIKQFCAEVQQLNERVKHLENIQSEMYDVDTRLQAKIDELLKQKNELITVVNNLKRDLQSAEDQLKHKDQVITESKTQKKMIFELKQERDQKLVSLKQHSSTSEQFKAKIQQLKTALKNKNNAYGQLNKQNQQTKLKLQILTNREKELNNKINQYQTEIKNELQHSNKISKQIKDVQEQLYRMKSQAAKGLGQKQRIVMQTERFNQILKQKVQMISEELQMRGKKISSLSQSYKIKEDQVFELGQLLIQSKDHIINLTNQIDLLRQENAYLTETVKELSQKEEKLAKLQEKLQHNDQILQDVEQRQQLRQIQLMNQIKYITQKKQERDDEIAELKLYISKIEHENLEYQDQIETVKLTLKNKSNELDYVKIQIERYRQNNIQFTERMILLKRSEDISMTSSEQIKEENFRLKGIIKENQDVMASLAKRHDSLYKSTMESVGKLYQLIRQANNLSSHNVKHERVQISAILNDILRFIANERNVHKQQMNSLQKIFEDEQSKNRQNVKIIKIKVVMIEQLEEEMNKMKQHQESLQGKIIQLQSEIQSYQIEIKEKLQNIRKLKEDLSKTIKQSNAQIAKRDQTIEQNLKQIQKLNTQIIAQIEKWKKVNDDLRRNMEQAEIQSNNKIHAMSIRIKDLETFLKQERQIQKQQKNKISQLQITIAKLSKEKQDQGSQLDKRTKQLIALRIQFDNKKKELAQKYNQIADLKKNIQKLQKQKNEVRLKNQRLEQSNKNLCIKKAQIQNTIKQRNNELLLIKMKINQVQDHKTKLMKQKEDITKSKIIQDELVVRLNQMNKASKDEQIKNQQNTNKLILNKENIEKELNKKITILTRDRNNLQKINNELKIKLNQKDNQNSEKYNNLVNQLKQSKTKVSQSESNIANLKNQINGCNAKITSMTSQITSKALQMQTKQKIMPTADKLKQILQFVNELKNIGKDFDSSKNKLLKMSNQNGGKQMQTGGNLIRQINIAINRFKIQILNKLNLTQQTKTILLDNVRNMQLSIEKFSKYSLF